MGVRADRITGIAVAGPLLGFGPESLWDSQNFARKLLPIDPSKANR
jgi:hypothetical protein